MPEKYTALTVNGGAKTAIVEGWDETVGFRTKLVCVDTDHAEFAERVAALLNREAEAKAESRGEK